MQYDPRVKRAWKLLLFFSGCEKYAAPAVTPEGTQPQVRDDPSKCVDAPAPYEVPDLRAQDAVMKAINELGECARNLAAPSNVMVQVHFRSDGAVKAVSILRADTDDCHALECVRQHLTRARAPVSDKGERRVGVDFTLRTRPAPDGRERVNWAMRAESRRCTDDASDDRSVPGVRAPTEIQGVVRASYGDLRQCYEAGLGHNPNLRGRVVFKVLVDPQGTVESVNVTDNQLPDCQVVACLQRRMINLRFREAAGKTTFVYPLMFEPG